jgi:hypothetical protein
MAHLAQPLSEYRIHGENISFTRYKRLGHYRWTRLAILRDACRRRGRPLWLRAMVFNAWVQWLVGRIPLVGESFPRLWSAADRVQAFGERLLLRPLAAATLARQGVHGKTTEGPDSSGKDRG